MTPAPACAPRHPRPRQPTRTAAETLRAVAGPAQLVAAAATLDAAFPALAEVLRRAAIR